jgi:hypothetical protein
LGTGTGAVGGGGCGGGTGIGFGGQHDRKMETMKLIENSRLVSPRISKLRQITLRNRELRDRCGPHWLDGGNLIDG